MHEITARIAAEGRGIRGFRRYATGKHTAAADAGWRSLIRMPRKKYTPLPEPLRYLQPFVNSLARLPAESVNEDIDSSRLLAALRKRLRGLDGEAAQEALAKDRDLLETWLKNTASPGHPAEWVLGFLLWPGVASHAIHAHAPSPPKPEPLAPAITFETPPGWKVTSAPFGLKLKKGKITGIIAAVDEKMFNGWPDVHEERVRAAVVPDYQAKTELSEVHLGACSGKKYCCQMTAPAVWRTVEYMLRVPGGCVEIVLGGTGFDESPIEAKVHTLRLTRRT